MFATMTKQVCVLSFVQISDGLRMLREAYADDERAAAVTAAMATGNVKTRRSVKRLRSKELRSYLDNKRRQSAPLRSSSPSPPQPSSS